MRLDDVRRLALALPGTSEQPHFDLTSFRVGKKIFATVPPAQDAVHVFVGHELAHAVAQEQPGLVELLWWGQKLSGVRVRLAPGPGPPGAVAELLAELLAEAWRRKAPRSAVARFDAGRE